VNSPTLELTPLRPAVRRDAPVTLDVLLRVTPPRPAAGPRRPHLNLGLVLDHSGSMAGANKMPFARQAAVYAIEQLLPEDRVSVVIFDDAVDVLVPATTAEDKGRIIEKINRVGPDGSTALHAGWAEGGKQVRGGLLAAGLNRVLLLTDGLANVGETNADNIATDVKRLAVEGVTTTTMGVGADYNEDLLEAMARSGDGNYYYIESPKQLPDIFQTELQGLMATVGRGVRLALEPQSGATVADVLNDFERDPDGRLALPNLIVGMPADVVVRLNVPPQANRAELLRVRLAWQTSEGVAQETTAVLALPAVGAAEWDALAADAAVQERAVLLQCGRLKRQATKHIEQGHKDEALALLRQARELLAALPRSPLVEEEERDLNAVESRLEQGDYYGSAKLGKYQHYQRTHSRPKLS
jgi:Ca-activated chloride channel family protein